MLLIHVTVLYTVKHISVGCLAPQSEAFLGSESVSEDYLPEDFNLVDFDFETCSGANCIEVSSNGKLSKLKSSSVRLKIS